MWKMVCKPREECPTADSPATAAETEAAVQKSPAQRDTAPEIRREF